jgi:Clp amino terminal domain, pathogenicity island component/ClpX C4-type zinc finger
MNEDLLRDAIAARDRLVEAQHHTDGARADYHHAIRRLHASGGSTREIARRLGLSHQRVHQIVDTAEPPATMAKKPSLLQRLAGERECAVAPGDQPRMKMLDRGKRLSGDAREVLLLAEDEARSLNHNYLGTEHILLGLLAARHSIAARILTRAGADLEEGRAAVERIIGRGLQQPATGPLALTPRAKKVLNHARKEAKFDHSLHTRGQHLLFGILRERNGVAAHVLTDLGVDRADVGKRIARTTRACSFCARNGAEVANLIAGPQVFICDRCTRDATRLATEPATEPAATLALVPPDRHDATCSFCGKHRTDVDHLVTGPAASICAECLAICREINGEEGIAPQD